MHFKLFSLTTFLAISLCCTSQNFNLVENYSLEDLEQLMEDFGIPTSLIGPRYGVDFYYVDYKTLHPNGDSVLVSAGLALPNSVSNCSFPMATYQHGTTFNQEDVPSALNDEALIGVLYSSQGFICPMPDYIGLGVDAENTHLYVHAESEAQAGLDLLRVVRDNLDQIASEWNNELFIFGYSQGGHAASALQRKIEQEFDEEFNVTASVPMSGPYDLSGAQTDYALSGEPYATPGYLPYIIFSYQEVYGDIYTELEEIFLPEYIEIFEDYLNGSIGLGEVQGQIPDIPEEMFQVDYLEDFFTNPNNTLRLALEDNDLLDWAPVAPTRVVYCTADEQVYYQNALNAIESWEENGSLDVESIDGGEFTHGGCVLPALFNGLLFFSEFATLPFTANIEFSVTDDTIGLGPEGTITADITTSENYTIEWSNGSTEPFISDLFSGEYECTVTSENGCSQTFTVEVGYNSINELETEFLIYPNPASNQLSISFVKPYFGELFVYNQLGELQESVLSNGNLELNLNCSELAQGIYFIKTTNGVVHPFLKAN